MWYKELGDIDPDGYSVLKVSSCVVYSILKVSAGVLNVSACVLKVSADVLKVSTDVLNVSA